MLHVGFILALGLQHQLLQNDVVASDDADLQALSAAVVRIVLVGPSDAKPVAAVVDRMGRI